MRTPFTDEYSIGIDREMNQSLTLGAALIRKRGRNFIGWTDVGGSYREEVRTLADGRSVPVRILTSPPSSRRFLLTNQPDYSLAYDGMVLAFDKRRSRSWQASGSYTYSRAVGLQPSNGTAAAPQVSTVSPPFSPGFGRDPNDLTNARGRLANDRPHMLRLMAT